ncbi:MAG: HAD family phosphatase, partial [Acidobacteria bacterium]|nr:HAD family phosphatase [Acidobacteriota bacterium]
YDGPVLRAVLFDFNGVLVDDLEVHTRLLERVLAEEKLPVESLEKLSVSARNDREVLASVLERAGRAFDAAEVNRLVARKAGYYQEHARRSGYSFYPGALELVEGAATQGLMLGIVSGALREEIVQALHQSGLRRHFKAIVSAEDVLRGRPHPEIYRRALEELNNEPPLPERLVHPHEVLAVENSPMGLAAASAAGLVSLGVAHRHELCQLVTASGAVHSLADIDPAGLQRIFAEASQR